MFTNANGRHAPPIQALDEEKTGRLCVYSNAEWRRMPPAPFGLLRKRRCASLRKLAGRPARLRFHASRNAVFAMQRIREHSVNRPY
jgi:hypothetical protein